MEMSSANEIRDILNEIDIYKAKLREIQNCKKLKVVITDGVNGKPTSYQADSIEVKAIRHAYEKKIEALKHMIHVMKWVKHNE